MDRWAGRTAVVTGAGGGIGSAIVLALGNAGLRVIGLDVNIPEDSSVKVTGSGSIEWRLCDVTKPDELAAAFEAVEDYGGTDVLINCAGYAKLGHITAVGDNPVSDDDVMRTMDVNIGAMIRCTRSAVASMKRRQFNGHVININSIAGHYISFTDDFNVYCSSKHAVTAFTGSLAHELAVHRSKIRTTSISPGMVRSAMSAAFNPDLDNIPHLTPKDVADAVVYVLSTPPHVNISELTIQPVGDIRK